MIEIEVLDIRNLVKFKIQFDLFDRYLFNIKDTNYAYIIIKSVIQKKCAYCSFYSSKSNSLAKLSHRVVLKFR